jgi:hypothetical protein
MRKRVFIGGLPAVLLALCLGCSGQGLNSATGKVTYKGAPIKGAMVFFHPKDANINSQRPSGITDESAVYTLTTGKKEGAPAGEYVVTVIWPEETPAKPKGKSLSTDTGMGDLIDRLKGRYSDSTTSRITAVIKSGSNTVPTIDLN